MNSWLFWQGVWMQEKCVFGFCSAASVWQVLSEADITKRSPTHSYTLATGRGSISSMKRSRVIIYYFCSFWNISSSHWQMAPFGVTLPSKHNKKNQIKSKSSVSDCTTTHTNKHTHVNINDSYETLCAAFCFFLFVSARLDAVTLIPALQVAAQEAGLRNSGPCACLKSLSLVMRVWLTQLVCLSANWVCLHERRKKKKSDIRGKC